mgnify:CR=1 FL=1
MELSRQYYINDLSGEGKLDELKVLLGQSYTQSEIDEALSNALAYSRLETADYLLSIGADITWGNYDGVYYSVHNGELEGLKYAISKGVDINANNGMPLNTSIITTANSKDIKLIKWILESGANINLLTKDSLSILERYGTDELKNLIKKVQQKADT